MTSRWKAFVNKNAMGESLNNLINLENEMKRAEYLQNLLVSVATSTSAAGNNDDYKLLRSYFLEDYEIKNLLPRWITTNRDLAQFWQFIKYMHPTYAERRNFIW